MSTFVYSSAISEVFILTATVDGWLAFAVTAAAVVRVADVGYDGLTIASGCPGTCRCDALYKTHSIVVNCFMLILHVYHSIISVPACQFLHRFSITNDL